MRPRPEPGSFLEHTAYGRKAQAAASDPAIDSPNPLLYDFLMISAVRPDSRVLVDSSALVYLIEDVPRRGAAVASFLDAVREAGGRPFASILVMTELLEGPLSRDDRELALRYRRFLTDSASLVLVPVDAEVAERAAVLLATSGVGAGAKPRAGGSSASRVGLSLADALHLATALVHKADAVLTNDEAWRNVPEAPEVFLVDELAADF